MRTSFHLTDNKLLEAYERLRSVLNANEEVIFRAAAQILQRHDVSFELPAAPSEFAEKHREITERLASPSILRGREIAMDLMEEVGRQIQATTGVPGVATDDLLNQLFLEPSNSDARLQLNPALRWQAEWSIPYPSTAVDEDTEVSLEVYSSEWGEVVPKYVVEYVNAAIDAHSSQMDGPALVLLSIAVEATLRDVLEPRGYTYNPGAPSVNIYSYVDADVGVDGNSYTVTFRQQMPKSPAQFLHSTGGAATVEIRVRRVIKQRQNKRTDLIVLAPLCLIDHWSSDKVQLSAQKRVNGLGEAFRIARHEEGFLAPADLATDLERIILLVRNNLVHLSGQALDEPLPIPASLQGSTLGDFLSDPMYVHDFVTSIPRFINTQYVGLRGAGHLAS